MKLLIITQAVDTEDPVLGFFVRWLEEFAKHVERIEVICLREGKHALPANVRVHSLGKERGVSRMRYLLNFYRHIWRLRHDYDAVFVHMNPEYVVLGGPLWLAWSKRIALWYTHKNVDMKLRLATMLVHNIFTASEESFRLSSPKVHVMGHGIDTDFFAPDRLISKGMAVLSVGRLSQTKRHDLIIHAAQYFPQDVRIVGEGPERQYLQDLARRLSVAPQIRFLGPQMKEGVREEYRRARVFVHTSETGSLDKVVLEALACGLPVITTSNSLSSLPVVQVSATPEAIAEGVKTSHGSDSQALVMYVREHHSLTRLVPAILALI